MNQNKNNSYKETLEQLVEDIDNGLYKANEKLPTLSQLCDRYQSNVAAVRKCLLILRDRGYIGKKSKNGHYVNDLSLSTPYTIPFHEDFNFSIPIDSIKVVECLPMKDIYFQMLTGFDIKRSFGCMKVLREFYSNGFSVAIDIKYLIFHHKLQTRIFQSDDWIDKMLLVLNHQGMSRKIKIIIDNESEDVREDISLSKNDPMYCIRTEYYDKNSRLACVSFTYAATEDIILKNYN